MQCSFQAAPLTQIYHLTALKHCTIYKWHIKSFTWILAIKLNNFRTSTCKKNNNNQNTLRSLIQDGIYSYIFLWPHLSKIAPKFATKGQNLVHIYYMAIYILLKMASLGLAGRLLYLVLPRAYKELYGQRVDLAIFQ